MMKERGSKKKVLTAIVECYPMLYEIVIAETWYREAARAQTGN